MAYLNVRERVIETKIAYVGAELSGKATNFEHLCRGTREGRASALEHAPVDGGALLSFEWRPNRTAQFNDCDVLVKLTATHGAVSDDQMKQVLDDADGVVFVIDADPIAQEKNRRTLEALKGLLASDVTREARPVVVQVNKSDLPNAIPPTELVGTLDVQAWPHVTASAASGEGVVETLLKAVENVIESVKHSSPDDDWESVETPTARAPKPSDGHPLLAALRQILRETISERVDALEDRVLERVERKLATWSDALGEKWAKTLSAATATLQSPLATLSKESASIRNAVASAGAETAALHKSMAALTSECAVLVKSLAALATEHQKAAAALTADVAATKKSVTALAAELKAVHGVVTAANGTSSIHQRSVDEATHTRESLKALHGQFDELLTELKKPKKSWFG